MRNFSLAALIVPILATGVCCSAQQKFPLRPGEWALITTDAGAEPMMFCLNDEMWRKALTQNPVCSIHELNVTSGGITYSMDCPTKTLQVKGKVILTFDGMEHMIGKARLDMSLNGNTTASSTSDYRWKSPRCGPDDINMRSEKTK